MLWEMLKNERKCTVISIEFIASHAKPYSKCILIEFKLALLATR